jgi:hypothetical protein
MATSTKFVGTAANDASWGGHAWSSASNVTADDGASATAGAIGEEDDTQYLKGTMAGNVFAVPAGATVDGVEVVVKRRDAVSPVGEVIDAEVRLVKGGVIDGDDKADVGTAWPASFGAKTYGGPSDLWGLTLTADDVNASNFGAALRAYCNATAAEPRVDYISLTVYYTAPSGAASATVMLMGGD